jgi:hypothetical protein
MKATLALLAGLAAAGSAAGAGVAAAPLPPSWAMLQVRDALPASAPERSAPASLDAPPAKSYAIPAAEIVGFQFLLNEFDRHHFAGTDFDSNLASIRRNLHHGWVEDRDPFLVNQLGHPYQGATYHGLARAAGLGYWEASAYAFLGSGLWEIAGETTPPSRNDQITTGIGGSFLGEALFRMASLVLEQEDELPDTWREIAAAAISPPVGFNRLAFGDRLRHVFDSRDPVFFTRLQLGASRDLGATQAGASTTAVHRDEALADFLIDYGLPGRPGYEYTRPFDYFSLQATASSADGFESLFTRGLLAGRAFGQGVRYRGVWGLYGNYDYLSPQTFRVATTGLSLGTTSEWRLPHEVAVQSTLLGGAGYTAAGTVSSTDSRDFHHGIAPEALAAVRVVFGTRAAIDATVREYYITRVAAADRGGHENIARADISFTWRVRGPHAVSIKYLANRRDSNFPDIGGLRQQRQTVGIFYTFLGRDRFGIAQWR